ncbi:alpha/beta fold hydrolase [Actinoplanes sp. NPDC026619]|uniref:thioesterase II family protein n=1 Tax=Actinoplanes sp. NPDC026619 TaxID=3155798 RepID=UPI0033F6FA08
MTIDTTAPARTGQTAYLPLAPPADDRLRLFCIPHAGGAASAFARWQARLGDRVAVLPVQLPGRGRRVGEARIRQIDRLVAELDEHLDQAMRQPFALYGHSMGALIAYRLTRRRQERGARLPDRLMVGACIAPHRRSGVTATTTMSDDELAGWLIAIGGMSPELLRYPKWVRQAIDLLRDDLLLYGSHVPALEAPLPVPVDVFAGTTDPLLPVEEAAHWALHTNAGSATHLMRGGHFFIQESEESFLAALRDRLHQLVP